MIYTQSFAADQYAYDLQPLVIEIIESRVQSIVQSRVQIL